MPTFQKPSKAARLRMKQRDKDKAARDLTALYKAVYQRDGYRCVACKRPVEPNGLNELERAHPHHIVFRSQATKAEKHTTRNVCTLCPICHGDIHDRTLFITGNADKVPVIRRVR